MSLVKQVARAITPRDARIALLKKYEQFKQPTVAEGWDLSAKYSKYSVDSSIHLGDQWSDPDLLNADVNEKTFVPYLDEHVFSPFIGTGDVILEIGSGGGRLTEILMPKCKRLIASDTSKSMVGLLKSRFKDEPTVEVELLDGLGLSQIPDNSVDIAFTFDVFVHLQPWDFYNYLVEIKRTLKPGGKAIVHHAHTLSDEGGWNKFLEDIPNCVNRNKYYGSFGVMTPELAKGFIESAGLEFVRQDTDTMPRDCISFMRSPAR